VLYIQNHVKVPNGISLSSAVTKFLNFSCNRVVISHVYMQQNVSKMKGARCLPCRKKTLPLEQHNKQFSIDCENSECPPPAFTHAFSLNGSSIDAVARREHCSNYFHIDPGLDGLNPVLEPFTTD